MNNDILASAPSNCTGSVPVDAVQLPSAEPTAEQLEQQLRSTLNNPNEAAWDEQCLAALEYWFTPSLRSSTEQQHQTLWDQYFDALAVTVGSRAALYLGEDCLRFELIERIGERKKCSASTDQPQKQKRQLGKRGKDRQQRSTNPKAWINDIAQIGFKGVQLQIALHIIGLCRKAHDQGKGGCGINRKRVQERYQRSLRTVEVVIQKLRDAGVITVERAKPQLKQKYGEQYGQFGKTSLTEAFRNGTWQPQPQADSTAASQPKTAAKAAVRTIFAKKSAILQINCKTTNLKRGQPQKTPQKLRFP